jgi:hypothetical protein
MKSEMRAKSIILMHEKWMYCRYDSYDFNERSTFRTFRFSSQQCGEWDHENSLKDGKVNTQNESRRCKILATTKGGNLIFQ